MQRSSHSNRDGVTRLAKTALKRLLDVMARGAGISATGRYFSERVTTRTMDRHRAISHHGVRLSFATPTALNEYRAESFASKEPETLEWIDAIPEGAVVWDIGANVGLYSCYAAKARGCRVFSFEPSVFNLELLARNIALNGLTDRVTVVPLPLSDRLGVSTLNMSTTEWGGALSTFGKDFGHDGEPMQRVFAFGTVGLTMGDAIERLGVPQPDFVKMDVDGIEHLILAAGLPVLRQVKSVLVEINDQFTEQAEASHRALTDAGFTMTAKKHAFYFDTLEGDPAQFTFNQIWTR